MECKQSPEKINNRSLEPNSSGAFEHLHNPHLAGRGGGSSRSNPNLLHQIPQESTVEH